MANGIIVPDEIMEEYGDLLTAESDEVPAEEAEESEPIGEPAEEAEEVSADVPEEMPGGEPAEDADERTVPLSALRQERAEKKKLRDELSKARAITDRLLEATGAVSLDDLEAKMDETQKMRVMRDRGIDGATAQMLLDMQRENASLRKSNAARRFDDEVASLAGNPFYGDISDVRDAVEEYARDKNISVKEAYNALYGEARALRLQEEARRQALQDRDSKDSRKIRGLSSAGNSPASEQGSLGLTSAELAAAKMAGMTPAEYKKYKEMEN